MLTDDLRELLANLEVGLILDDSLNAGPADEAEVEIPEADHSTGAEVRSPCTDDLSEAEISFSEADDSTVNNSEHEKSGADN